jgi:hypothetical protein
MGAGRFSGRRVAEIPGYRSGESWVLSIERYFRLYTDDTSCLVAVYPVIEVSIGKLIHRRDRHYLVFKFRQAPVKCAILT